MSKKLCIFANHFMDKNDKPYIIAGPCSIESREQLTEVTKALCSIPKVQLIRGGVWKPRTRPGGFEGLGEPALKWMKELQENPLCFSDGSPVRFCCEVASPEHVELCLHYGITTLWLGARTTANPFMVEELSNALRGADVHVMVKNPLSPDLRLWLGAIERLSQVGIKHLAAIHRGFSMYNSQGYRNAPLWELPLKLRSQCPDLPIISDPSHIGGSRQLTESLCISALQLDLDGLMIEVHPHPDDALTDALQQLTPGDFKTLVNKLVTFLSQPTVPSDTRLTPLRQQIDDIDHELLRLLAQRMELSREIAAIKQESQMTVYQGKRWNDVLNDRLQLAESLGIDTDFTKNLLETIHGESLRIQMI